MKVTQKRTAIKLLLAAALIAIIALCFSLSTARGGEIDYLAFSGESSFTLKVNNSTKNWDGTIEYSTDKTNWSEWDGTTVLSSSQSSPYALYLRGTNNTVISGSIGEIDHNFVLEGENISCSGNIETLLDYQTVALGNQPEMGANCFAWLFYNNANLISAPKLPSKDLANGCYAYMFRNTGLTVAPELPATTMKDSCYTYMFQNVGLTVAPKLPADSLATECYRGMFFGCKSLMTAPALPAESMAPQCYSNMFYGCTSLTTPPALPAESLASQCYVAMFYGCTSLASAPELPATVLAEKCYDNMFYSCTSLVSAPKLPALDLAPGCYQYMFHDCKSLKTAPELPAENLADNCYNYMFYGCSSLTVIPKLPATTLAYNCYYAMFSGCASLKVSEVKTEECAVEWSIPAVEGTDPLYVNVMLADTGGSFKGKPEYNTTYYVSAVVPSDSEPEPAPPVTSEHYWDEQKGYDEDNHWYVCKICDDVWLLKPHTYSSEDDLTCEECGYSRAPKPTEPPTPTEAPTEPPKPTEKPTEAPKPTDLPKPTDAPIPTPEPIAKSFNWLSALLIAFGVIAIAAIAVVAFKRKKG